MTLCNDLSLNESKNTADLQCRNYYVNNKKFVPDEGAKASLVS